MRRSDHPSRPSAITCCRFSALKTLPIPAAGVQPTAEVNISAPGAALAGFQVSINGRFWVSTEALRDAPLSGPLQDWPAAKSMQSTCPPRTRPLEMPAAPREGRRQAEEPGHGGTD